MTIRVISDSAGFSLIFDRPKDLRVMIDTLSSLEKDRKDRPSKSWPALAGFYGKGQRVYAKTFMRWLRYAFNPKGWSD